MNNFIIKEKKFLFESKNFNDLSELLLNEAMGSFEDQYTLADELSNVIYDMLMNNIINLEYKTENDKVISIVDITINKNTPLMAISGAIKSIDPDLNKISIFINISDFNLKIHKPILLKRIKDVVVHELMHGNIFLKRYENNQNINDMPFYYDSVVYLMGQTSENDILYWFSYALYSTYYHEVNAVVSQTNAQLFNMLGYGNKHDNETIKKAIKSLDSYQIYNRIINFTVPYINNMDDDDINNKIVKQFNNIGVEINVKWVRDKLNEILLIAQKAIKKIFKNALLEGNGVKQEVLL